MLSRVDKLLRTTVVSSSLLLGCGGGGEGGSQVGDGSGGNSGIIPPKYSDTVSDPLGGFLWHLKNIGQSNFLSLPSSATTGTDINIGDLHQFYRGSGYTVVVADGRIDLNHPDLTANADLANSKNYALSMSPGVNPTSIDDTDFHGTAVTGIVGASKGNGLGIFGVSPLAKLVGLNLLDSDQSASKLQDMTTVVFGGVYNYSFGYNTCTVFPASLGQLEYMKWQSTSYKEIYVTSGGNDFVGGRASCGGGSGIYLGNGNLDQTKSHPYLIVTAAISNQGTAATYSTPSANTWISAPGGESYQDGGLPMLSTDLVGCSAGQARSSSTSAFDRNTTGTNADCAYATDGVTGTSFASPTVAGAIPLILENLEYENRNLRTVKHVLASTAKKIDPSSGNMTHPAGADLPGHIYQNGWVRNAAGFNFHNWYGFGLIDVTAAVAFAKNLKGTSLGRAKLTYLPGNEYYYKSGASLGLTIPDSSSTGVQSSINVGAHALILEHVMVKVNITHPYRGDLGIEITSPSGTTSKLMNINSGIVGANLVEATFGSNAFYGERSNGVWTIKVLDGAPGDVGTLNNWAINFMGRAPKNETYPANLAGVTSVSNTGNTITWVHSTFPNVLRYEAAVQSTSSTTGPKPFEWFPISPSTNSFNVTKYSIINWFNISAGSAYKIRIRVIDQYENESEIAEHTWLAVP